MQGSTPFVQGMKNSTPGIPLYDTIEVAQAAAVGSEVQFFAVPKSPTKGLHLTNLEVAGMLAGTRKFVVHGVRIAFKNNIFLADLVAMQYLYVFELEIAGKKYCQAPLEYFPGGAGIAGVSAVTTTASTTTIERSAFSNGAPTPQAAFLFGLERAITITPSTPFGARLVSTVGHTATASGSGGTGIGVRCYLEGINEREVS